MDASVEDFFLVKFLGKKYTISEILSALVSLIYALWHL